MDVLSLEYARLCIRMNGDETRRLTRRRKMVRTAGFEPTAKRHFTRKNTSHSVGEPKVNQLQADGDYNAPFTPLPETAHQCTLRGVVKPETIRYRNLTARITYTKKKGLFLAYWNCGGNKGNMYPLNATKRPRRRPQRP